MTTVSHVSEKIDSDPGEAAVAGLEWGTEETFYQPTSDSSQEKENSDVAGVLNDPRWDMDFVKKFPKKEMNTFVLIGKWTLH